MFALPLPPSLRPPRPPVDYVAAPPDFISSPFRPPLCLISGITQTWHDHRPGETQVWNQPGWPPYQEKLTYGIPRPDVLKNGNARATIKVLSSGLFDWPHCEGKLKYGIPGPGDTTVVILMGCITQTLNPCTVAAYYRTYGYFFCSFFKSLPVLILISGNTQVWHDHRPGETQVWIQPGWPS